MPSASDSSPLRGTRLSRQDLLEALEQRDGQRLAVLSRRWAHRQGVEALHGLIHGPQIEETARLWWLEQLERPLAGATVVAQLAPPAPSPAPETSTPEHAGTSEHTGIHEHAGVTPEPAGDSSMQFPQAVSASDQTAGATVLLETTILPGATIQPGVSEDVTSAEPERPAALMPEAASEPAAEPPSTSSEKAAAGRTAEPLPPMAEVFGPIHGLEPLPSFNVAAIFAMQSELAEKPLAPPIIPPVAAAPVVEPPSPTSALAAPQEDDQVAAQPAPSEAPAPPVQPVMASPFEGILFPSQSADAATAELPATPTAAASVAAAAPEATGPQAPPAEVPAPTPPRRNPFSRLRTLWQDCVDEVASTFRGEEPEVLEHHFDMADPADAEPMPVSPSAASARAAGPASSAATAMAFPSLFATQPAEEPAAERPSIAPPPFPLQQAPQPAKARRRRVGESAATAAQPTGRPAPAPSHPALDSLRSWLPDSLDQHDQRRAS